MAGSEEIRDRIGDAISDALASETEMVTRWAVLIEVVDAQGERAVYSLVPAGAKAWDTLGLLTFGVQLEQAAVLRDES